MPAAWDLQSLNASEATVATRELVPTLPQTHGKRYLVGDSAFDTNALYAAAAQRGYQLLAPPKRRGRGLGHQWHHPARLAGLAQLQTPYGQHLYRQRTQIERSFGHWAVRPEGLSELPAHVRRLHRVKRFVQGKFILNGFHILKLRHALPLPAA